MVVDQEAELSVYSSHYNEKITKNQCRYNAIVGR